MGQRRIQFWLEADENIRDKSEPWQAISSAARQGPFAPDQKPTRVELIQKPRCEAGLTWKESANRGS
jgi:hypothetical protein